jgi:Fur family ferric uptake transcriptional regulator
VDLFARALAASGLRLTRPRLAVLEALAGAHSHLTAEEVLARGRERHGALSRPTVYRTLELLASMNLIRPVWQSDGRARYVVVADGHHHLVCTGCGAVQEVPGAQLVRLKGDIREQYSFRVTGHLLEIYGECSKCL